jgi:hypothetical protein
MMQLPLCVGPYELKGVGGLVTLRGPADDSEALTALRRAHATWDKGTRTWWLRASRAERLARDLAAIVDPLLNWRP